MVRHNIGRRVQRPKPHPLDAQRKRALKQWNSVWQPNRPFGDGFLLDKVLTLHQHRKLSNGTLPLGGTPEDPVIYWTSKPKDHDWKTAGLKEAEMDHYEERHNAIAKQECLKWGWRYVIIRKEIHLHTNKGKKKCDPHITIYLSMTPDRVQMQGHWFCLEDPQRPGCPTNMMEDGTVQTPKTVPSRELYPVGQAGRQYLPGYEPAHRPPTATAFAPALKTTIQELHFPERREGHKRKRVAVADEVDQPEVPAPPGVGETLKRAKARTEEDVGTSPQPENPLPELHQPEPGKEPKYKRTAVADEVDQPEVPAPLEKDESLKGVKARTEENVSTSPEKQTEKLQVSPPREPRAMRVS